MPDRVDLRASACYPYPLAFDQGEAQSCVAQAFSTALYCLKAEAKLLAFPKSRVGFPMTSAIFEGALSESHDPRRGTSFHAVINRILARHHEDLDALGWRMTRVPNDLDLAKRLLRAGAPVVAGYQVNAATAAFHTSPDACERHGYLLPSFRADPRPVSAHAVLLVGYDDAVGSLLARNSWGDSWGVDGHFLVRYEDFLDPAHFTDVVGFERLGAGGSGSATT